MKARQANKIIKGVIKKYIANKAMGMAIYEPYSPKQIKEAKQTVRRQALHRNTIGGNLGSYVVENTWLTRNLPPHLKCDFGWGNGYVLIPKGHPFWCQDYDFINNYVDVHSGLTYASLITVEQYYLGIISRKYIGYWSVGFDTCHCWDNQINCSKMFVEAETERLKKQLIEIQEKGYVDRIDE